jgi:hypothetical protein
MARGRGRAWVHESFGKVVELMRLALDFINSHLVQEAGRSIEPGEVLATLR